MPYVDLYFKKAEGNVENIVEAFSGKYVHVEMVLSDHNYMYTSFMFEAFTQNKIEEHNPQVYTQLRLQVTPVEHENIVEMLMRLTDKSIPYNYTDLPWCVFPTFKTLRDVVQEEDIKQLFCSQAIILVLRMNLSQDSPAFKSLSELNSRTTPPNTLFEILKPHGEII